MGLSSDDDHSSVLSGHSVKSKPSQPHHGRKKPKSTEQRRRIVLYSSSDEESEGQIEGLTGRNFSKPSKKNPMKKPNETRKSRKSLSSKTIDSDEEPHTSKSQYPDDSKETVDICPLCGIEVRNDDRALECDQCDSWFHAICQFVRKESYEALKGSEEPWICFDCDRRKARKRLPTTVIKRRMREERFSEDKITETLKKIENGVDFLRICVMVCAVRTEETDDFALKLIVEEENSDLTSAQEWRGDNFFMLGKLSDKQRMLYGKIANDSDKDYIHCSLCNVDFVISCKQHPLFYMMESETDELVEVRPSLIHGFGVFACQNIPVGIVLGPYRGKVISHETSSGYAWELLPNLREENHTKGAWFVDAEGKSKSNWLRYVNCPQKHGEENLEAFQLENAIYYRVCKWIIKGCELLVWYGNNYDHTESAHKSAIMRTPKGLYIYYDRPFKAWLTSEASCVT